MAETETRTKKTFTFWERVTGGALAANGMSTEKVMSAMKSEKKETLFPSRKEMTDFLSIISRIFGK